MTGNEKIKQYLLGSLAADEAREMDSRIIAEPDLEAEFLLAEDDLMDDYLDGILSPSDAELFRRNFLVSGERLSALRHLALLKKYAQAAAVSLKDEKTAGAIGSAGWLDNLKSIFRLNTVQVKAVFALLLVCAAIGVGWRLISYERGDQFSTRAYEESLRLNRQDLSDLAGLANVYQTSLTAGAYRNSGTAAPLLAEKFNNTVLFRLLLPPLDADDALFDVRLIAGQKEVLKLEGIGAYKNPDGQELRVLFPASVVAKGDYRIEVSKETAAASPLVYSFTVR